MKNDKLLIQDMLESGVKAIEYLGDKDFDLFSSDTLLQDAIVRRLEVLGEAASQISKEFQSLHNELDWKGIIGLRNRLIHGYDYVDIEVIWKILKEDLPDLILKIKKI